MEAAVVKPVLFSASLITFRLVARINFVIISDPFMLFENSKVPKMTRQLKRFAIPGLGG